MPILSTLRKKVDLLQALEAEWRKIRHAPFDWTNDEVFMLAAVATNFRTMARASPRLKGDCSFLRDALKYDWRVFLYATEEAKRNLLVAMSAFFVSVHALAHTEADVARSIVDNLDDEDTQRMLDNDIDEVESAYVDARC